MLSRIIALLFILLLSPLYLFISIVIFLGNGRPIFITQNRTLIGKKNIRLYKFRTMKIGTPDKASRLLSGPEKYILSTGKVLRQWSLDELPQLFNVFKGEMNFIGPRPLLENERDVFKMRIDKNIIEIEPGITGWAQVNGRDNITNEERVEYDYFYMKNRSIIFDFKILVMTFIKTILRKDISH